MNTKKKSGRGLLTVLLLSAFLFQCNTAETEHHVHAHPSNNGGMDMEHLIASPNKIVMSRQATVKLSAPLETSRLTAQGYIDLDRGRNQTVSARFSGRIEKLYVRYDWQSIKKGDKVLELYSPDINTFQEEHLFLLKSAKENALTEQSRQKLKLFGITENQISQLEKSGTFVRTITIYRPGDGYVFFNSGPKDNNDSGVALREASTNMDMSGIGNPQKQLGTSPAQIREGTYINTGDALFMINDLQHVWAIISVSPEFRFALDHKSEVKIMSEFFSDKPLTGRLALIERTFEEDKQRFVRARISLPNREGLLKLNSLVTAEISARPNGSFQIPISAVFRTGLNSFVWVKTGTTPSGTGIFALRKVFIGSINNGMTAITRGLSPHEEVAEQAGYLTDSETFLNEN